MHPLRPAGAPAAELVHALACERRQIGVAFAAQNVAAQPQIALAIPAAVGLGRIFGQREELRLRIGRLAAQDGDRGIRQPKQRRLQHAQQPIVAERVDRRPQQREPIEHVGARKQRGVAGWRDRDVARDERRLEQPERAQRAVHDRDASRRRTLPKQSRHPIGDRGRFLFAIGCAEHAHGRPIGQRGGRMSVDDRLHHRRNLRRKRPRGEGDRHRSATEDALRARAREHLRRGLGIARHGHTVERAAEQRAQKAERGRAEVLCVVDERDAQTPP